MEGVTGSILGPKESDMKLQVEENVETCPKSEENLAEIEEHGQIITKAEPLAWIPASDHVYGQVQHRLLMPSYVDGKIFRLPEGWVVERRPRTSLKYIGKVDKFYYEPGTRRQFRTLKAAQKHVKEMKRKQNYQQPQNDHNQDRELSQPQPENDYNQATGQKHEHKPVTLELGDESEPGARSRFRRLKDVHKFLRARKGQQNNQKPILVDREQQPKIGEVEETVKTCPETEENEPIVTGAEPLAWLPPADHVYGQVQHPLLLPSYVDGQIFKLPKGWLVEQRPRTSLKYIGKVDKFYYEPGTNRQFRSWKAAQQHLEEMKGKQNDQQPLRPRPENDRELSRPQPENGYDQTSEQKHEHKPVTLELGDESEPGARSRIRRLKDVHKYLRTRKGQQNNQQPENNNEQASGHNHDQTPILVYGGEEQSKVSHEKADENSRDEQSKKRKQTLCIEFDFPNPPKKVKWTLTDAENDLESNVQTSVVRLGEQQTDAENEQWNPNVGQKLVLEAVKDSWVKTFNETVDPEL